MPRRSSWMIFPGSASRSASSLVACVAARTRRVPAASSGPRSSVWSDEMSVSRPKTVMNHGVPAASRCPSANLGHAHPERREIGERPVPRVDEVVPARAQHWSRAPSSPSSTALRGAAPRRARARTTRPTAALLLRAPPAHRPRAASGHPARGRARTERRRPTRRTPPTGGRRFGRRTTPSEKISVPLPPRSGGCDRRQRLVCRLSETGLEALDDEDVGEVGGELQPELDCRRDDGCGSGRRSAPPCSRRRSAPARSRARSAAGRRRAGSAARTRRGAASEWSCERGSRRAPPSVSTERERKRVSEAKKPDAVARPSTSPRSSQTQKVDPSRTVRGKG